MIGWKKLALVSSFAAFGVVIALLLSAGAIYRYNHRTRSRKDWPPISLIGGIKAELHTELRSGSVRYAFTVKPLSSYLADDFERTASDQAIIKSFRVLLRDAGGFEP